MLESEYIQNLFASTRKKSQYMYADKTMQHHSDAIYYTSGQRIDVERQRTIELLRRKMWDAAGREDYERAATLRDRIEKLTKNKSD